MKHGKIGVGVANGKLKHIMVEMPYIGSALSVNHCYFTNARGQRVLYPEAKEWRQTLAMVIRSRMGGVVIEPPLTIRIQGRFRDKRHPDPDNLHKIIGDAVKMGTGVDDRHFLWQDGEPIIDKTADPMLIITIQGGE